MTNSRPPLELLTETAAVDKVDRISEQYAKKYEWSDREAVRLYFRLEELASAMRAAADRVHGSILPNAKGWLVAVLRAIYLSPNKRLSHVEIGNETRVPAANVTYQVDVLEKDGYVVRVPHPEDRRVTYVELTTAGEELCEMLLPARVHFINDLASILTPEETRLMNDLAERLQKHAEAFKTLD